MKPNPEKATLTLVVTSRFSVSTCLYLHHRLFCWGLFFNCCCCYTILLQDILESREKTRKILQTS